MKRIKLIKTAITNSQVPEDFELDYKKEFSRIVEVVPEGCTVSQMATAIKVAGKIASTPAGEDLILEDAETEYLANKLKSAKFAFVAPELVAMVEAVEKAEDVKTPHLKSADHNHDCFEFAGNEVVPVAEKASA